MRSEGALVGIERVAPVAVPVGPRPLSLLERLAKRGLDIAVAWAGLVLLAPLLVLAALLVKLTSRGPVLYRWRVVGEGGRPFTGYKFRSMRADADALRPSLEPCNEMRGPVFKMAADPRVTPLGRFLRRYSLDELPQLWSVFKGDMSLVGPRPPLRTEYERFESWQRAKLCVRPGITCLWQIGGRSDIRDFDDWVRMDLEYARRRSFWLDLKILALTVPAVLRARGSR
jgi:lipopolysaccharide/colanic/teichoic acid biosynthesis glycosyltransferase